MGDLAPHWASAEGDVTVYLGKCEQVLPRLPAESVDAIVTDPPAAIGFIGRDWDADLGGRDKWVAWLAGVMREAGRVLKPGGHALVWSLPRTSHWTALALEDAGLEIRDCVMHLFGCLTDDVDVLTERGWVRGIEVKAGERIAQWDAATSAISLAEVQETFRAPWSGDLARFHNSDTDQALTPNHRVWHRGVLWKRWSDYRVAEAAAISRRSPCRLPLAGLHDGPGIGGEDYAALLGWVWTEGGFDKGVSTGVRIYQSSVNQPKVDEIAALMDRLGPHKRYDYDRTYRSRRDGAEREYTAVTWFFTGELAQRVRADLPGKHPAYDLLWRMTLAEKRAFLAAALAGDGCRQRKSGAWTFYQDHDGDLEWFVTLLALVGWRGHKASRKAPRTGGNVSVTQHADTTLSLRNLQDDREHYEGDVWCVRVPSGAFVARRHGKVFVTGNSGFPKSLDVGKAIDARAEENIGTKRRIAAVAEVIRSHREAKGMTPQQVSLAVVGTPSGACWNWEHQQLPSVEMWPAIKAALGIADEYDALIEGDRARFIAAEREVIGSREVAVDQWTDRGRKRYAQGGASYEVDVTAPATEDAARWDGWGTALKPGQEMWWLARKPLRGTVAATVLEFGTGALNVDGCRVGSGGQLSVGRWPANIVLTHSAACNGACAADCPVAELDRQSGVSTSTGGSRGAGGQHGAFSRIGAQPDFKPGLGDAGGASRFYPVFRYQAKAPTSERPRLADGTAHETVKPLGLIRWLARLITPPGGTVLDCFAGTGPVGEAAVIEGFRAVLIDQDPKSAGLMARRFARPIQPLLFTEDST